MPATLSKIQRLNARLRGTAAETIPGHYDIVCDCGCQVSGQRGTSSKQVDCPECHTSLYILPTNVYPATPSVDSDVIGGSFGNRLRVVMTEVIPGLGRKQANRKPDPSPKPRRKKAETPDEAAASARRWSIPRPKIPRINPVQVLRRTFTPLRLLALAMIALIGVTSFQVLHNRQYEAAKQIWLESTDAIPELIESDDFESLQDSLQAAADAGAVIGQQGPEWRRVTNLLQETQSVTNVSFETITELLSDLAALPAAEDQDLGGLESALTSSAFVIDGYIDPTGSRNKEFTLDIPVMSGDTPVQVSLLLPQLTEYLEQNESRRFVCAFRVREIRVAKGFGPDNGWRVDVAPESFVLMTSEPHCRRLGFTVESDPSLEEVLSSQRQFVEQSDAWETRAGGSGQSSDFAFLGN